MKAITRAGLAAVLVCGFLKASGGQSTSTSLSITPSGSSSTLGQTVVLGATVTSGSGPVNLGSVTFYDGTVPVGTGTFNENNGEFDLKTALLPAGGHSLSVRFD